MIRSVPNSQAGTGVPPRGSRWMTGNDCVVNASTKEFLPFRRRIQRSSDRGVVFSLSGRIELQDVADLQRLLNLVAAGQDVEFDLQDVTLVDRDAVKFLARCETESVKLENCPAYVDIRIAEKETERASKCAERPRGRGADRLIVVRRGDLQCREKSQTSCARCARTLSDRGFGRESNKALQLEKRGHL